jgi:hypothetical protein
VGDAAFPVAHVDAAADEVGDVEVVLDVLDRAVVGQLVEDLLDLLFCREHGGFLPSV